MVAIESEVSIEEVMPPKLQGLYDGKELPVVIGITPLCVVKLLAEVGYRVRILR